jgi:hypothetical protein
MKKREEYILKAAARKRPAMQGEGGSDFKTKFLAFRLVGSEFLGKRGAVPGVRCEQRRT